MLRNIRRAAAFSLFAIFGGQAAAISGKVSVASASGAQGTPVEGASITLYRRLLDGGGRDSALKRLDSTVTGAQGEYGFAGVDTGEISLFAQKPGYAHLQRWIRGRVSHDTDRYAIDIVFPDTTPGGLKVTVLRDSAQGSGLAGASIVLGGFGDEPKDTVQADANGQYTFARLFPTLYTLSVRADGFQGGYASPTVLPGETVAAQFILWPKDAKGAITGTIMKAADGGPVSGAKAILSRVVDGVDSFPKDTATSDAAGNYTFGNVPALPGFAITVQAEGYQTAAATGLAVAYAHTLRADFPLIPATQIGSGPGSVAGFVTDSAQGALAGARIILDSAGSDGRSRLASQTDAQGRFVFPKVNAGDYRLSVSRDGYMPLEIVGLSVSPDRTLVERLALRKAPINGLQARTREAMRLRAGPAGRLILTAPAGPVAGRVRVYDARGTLRFSGTLLPGAARLEIPWASGRTGYVVVERAGEVHRFRFPAGR